MSVSEPATDYRDYYHGPVWCAFGLTYAGYYVVPRRSLQSMPSDWQERFVALVNEMHATLPSYALDGDWIVTARNHGKFAKDTMADYRHAGPVTRKGDTP